MRISKFALATIVASASRASAQTKCIEGAYDFSFKAECNYANLLEEFTRVYADMIKSPGCTNDAEAELLLHLGAATPAEGKTKVHQNLCIPAWDEADSLPFSDIARSNEADFEQRYYNGGSYWNEEVETKYEYPLGEPSNVLSVDAARVRRFYESDSEHTRVETPHVTNNFDVGTCDTNAVMCCWTTDRQANDGNGNCKTEYDLNCVDKDPGDNTDLCYVDLERGNASTGFDSTGIMVFDGENDDGEGAIHCHGYAWAEDEYDTSSRYAGNNLFFVSMYDHMTQRGYVRNVPGAPMCACTDQMPVVTRSDCTQLDVEETYTVEYNGAQLSASLVDVLIDFNSCQGLNNQNNDLWAYMQRLYYTDKKVSSDKLAALSKVLVEDANCPFAIDAYMAEKGYIEGYNVKPNEWIQVAGRDALKSPSYGMFSFNRLLSEITRDNGIKLLRRVCLDCKETHQHIYYRRLTPVPADCDLLYVLKNSRSANGQQDGCNVWNVDFTMHSTLDDAVTGDNPWQCAGGIYRYGDGFPGDCSPDGTRVTGQESRFNPLGWKENVGWYVESANFHLLDPSDDRSGGLIAEDIGRVGRDGSTRIEIIDGEPTYYVAGSGDNISGDDDEFHFLYQTMEAGTDFTLSVHIKGFDGAHEDSKAGLMIRETLDDDSKHTSVLLRFKKGIELYYRKETGGRTSIDDIPNVHVEEAHIMITKQGNKFTGFQSEDGNNWWQIGEEEVVLDATTPLYVGMAVSARNDGKMAEAVFDKYETFANKVASIVCARQLTQTTGSA